MISSVLLIVAIVAGLIEVNSPRNKPLVHVADQEQDKPWIHEDDGGGLSFEDDKPRIDRFAKELKSNNAYTGYVIAYGGLVSYRNEAGIRLRCIRDHLKNAHGIPSSRLRLIDGGYSVEVSVRLFLVKPEDPKPTPYGFINREAVRMRKTPKYPCGKPRIQKRKVT